MTEDMDKDESARCEPRGDLFEKCGVGFHVFKHLDRHDVGKPTSARQRTSRERHDTRRE